MVPGAAALTPWCHCAINLPLAGHLLAAACRLTLTVIMLFVHGLTVPRLDEASCGCSGSHIPDVGGPESALGEGAGAVFSLAALQQSTPGLGAMKPGL